MNPHTLEEMLPLTAQSYHILLALIVKPMHAYGLLLQMEVDSGGCVKMRPGNLYKSIDRLENLGLVKKGRILAGERSPFDRQQYKLTAWGNHVLDLEAQRLNRNVRLAKSRNIGF